MKPIRRTAGSDSVGGSGRSSRSSSITSDRSGSLNSIPGSVTSCESRYLPLTRERCNSYVLTLTQVCADTKLI